MNSDATSDTMLSDFPKIQCPFIRQDYKVNVEQWEKHGSRLNLRTPSVRLVVNAVNPGFEWVFDDPDTIAVEKLDGTNVKLLTEKGRLIALQNRKNVIDPLQIIKGKKFIIEGIFNSIEKDYVKQDGEQVGELIGPKLQGNPYKLTAHEWYPFAKSLGSLAYRSFLEHDRTFDNLSSWFKDWLFSRYYTKKKGREKDDNVFAEGVVFYNLRRKAEQQSYMAKLRRNMFDWYYTEWIEIYDYDKNKIEA